MRNAYLDDLRDQNYKEAVAAEWKEIRSMDAKKTQTTKNAETKIKNIIRSVAKDIGWKETVLIVRVISQRLSTDGWRN